MVLYRPMDMQEVRLVYEMGMRGFPPRKPEQPIFYPVLNLEYASEIARRWNTESPTAAGYVAKFAIDDAYGAGFEPRQVGAAHHVELWVKSDDRVAFAGSHLDRAMEAQREGLARKAETLYRNSVGEI